jgi:hypothetical protein
MALINAEHFARTPIKEADLLFVCGTRDGIEERIDSAQWTNVRCPASPFKRP